MALGLDVCVFRTSFLSGRTLSIKIRLGRKFPVHFPVSNGNLLSTSQRRGKHEKGQGAWTSHLLHLGVRQ